MLEPSSKYHIDVVQNVINQFYINLEKALDEYLQFKYDTSGEELKKVISNVNNFKLEHNNFRHIVQGHLETYYDGDEVILTINRNTMTICKEWLI